jgi:hypothetical protein
MNQFNFALSRQSKVCKKKRFMVKYPLVNEKEHLYGNKIYCGFHV